METLTTSYEIAYNLQNANSVKTHSQYQNGGEFGEVGTLVLEFIRDCSGSFCSDIAKKALTNGWDLSDKQAWCVSFEFIKIKHQFAAWAEQDMKKNEWSAADMETVLSKMI